MMCAVGARNINRANFDSSSAKMPSFDDLTYQGLFNEYYYIYSQKEEQQLVGADITTALTINETSKKQEYYVNIGLMSKYDGQGIKTIGRPPVKICFVLDVSGSMGSVFPKESKQVIDIAKDVILHLLQIINPNDSLSIVLFNNSATLLFPMTTRSSVNVEEFKKLVSQISQGGGTNFQSGYRMAFDIMKAEKSKSQEHQLRIMYLTDACPNQGEIHPDSLLGMSTSASENQIYSTFFGIGLDFNTQLIEQITKCKGSSYYSIHNEKEFHQNIAQDFDYIVFPVAFDVYVSINGEIVSTYGSPQTDKDFKGGFAFFSSLDASAKDERGTKGGAILLQIKEPKDDLFLTIQFKTRDGKDGQVQEKINFLQDQPYFQDEIIRKTVLLKNHIDFLRNIFSQENNQVITQQVKAKEGKPSDNLSNRIQSLENYRVYFQQQIELCKDRNLEKELKSIDDLITQMKQQAQILLNPKKENQLQDEDNCCPSNAVPQKPKYFM